MSEVRAAWTLPEAVLIETLWNVKIINPWVIYFASRVLIETLWNVKKSTRRS